MRRKRETHKENQDTSANPKELQVTAIERVGPTGPRTPRGKAISRWNALKHGIFAEGLVEGESRKEYENLLRDLIEEFRPVGRLETIEVEKLAMLYWRYRRFLNAEAALASSAVYEIEHRTPGRKIREAVRGSERGLLHEAFEGENPYFDMRAVEELNRLRQSIEEDGLDWERDRPLLTEIYGRGSETDPFEPSQTKLVSTYHELVFGKEGDGNTTVSKPEAKKQMIELVDDTLEVYAPDAFFRPIEKEREIMRSAAIALVPAGETGERFQRYETMLDRAIDRCLARIERLQRMRLGLGVLPPIKVEVD